MSATTCPHCIDAIAALSMEGIRATNVGGGISTLGEARDEALARGRKMSLELEAARREISELKAERARLARELDEADVDNVRRALCGTPGSIEVEPGGYRAMSVGERVTALRHDLDDAMTRANLAEEVARKERDRADMLLRELKRAESDVTLFRGERDHAQFNAEQAAIRAEHLADRLRALGQDPDA